MTHLEIRSFDVRAVDTEARTITGIAVPFDTVTDVGGMKEKFARGAFGDIADVKLFYGHENPIGLVTKGKDTEHGYEIEARISKTAKGDEVYELLRDGVLNKFSVGFVPVEDRMDEDVVVRTKATLKEVSVVPFPAYDGANVLAVREDSSSNNNSNERGHIENNMTTDNYATVADLADVRDAVAEVERRIASGTETVETGTQFRSGGDFLKAVNADDTAKRAYTGAVLADSHTSNDWKANLLTIVDRGRPVVNLFSRAPLGDHGMTVEYPKVGGITGDVSKQVAEGDDLAYMELAITTGSAPVNTYGAHSQLSRQVIERSDVSYLDAVLKAQAASYAKITNGVARAAMVAATPQTGTSFTLSSATAASFLDATVDAVNKIDLNALGAQADFILVSQDVFAKMASVASTGFAFDVNNSNGQTIGSVNVRGLSGSLAGLPIVVDTGLAAKSFYVASSNAVTTFEDSRSPIRLDDENPVNLTKVFSLYGYLAVGVTNANGLVKATVA